jgi:hypothetical protein
MELNDQFDLEHLFFTERKCRSCKNIKSLTDSFYRIRKNNTLSSSYSYECKDCTIKRIIESKKKKVYKIEWEYPDW